MVVFTPPKGLLACFLEGVLSIKKGISTESFYCINSPLPRSDPGPLADGRERLRAGYVAFLLGLHFRNVPRSDFIE